MTTPGTMVIDRRTKINSLLIAATLLITYLAMFFNALFLIDSPTLFLAVIILSVALYNNRLRFSVSFVMFVLTVISVILISYLIHGSNEAILPTVLYYLVFGVALTYAATFGFSYNELIKYIYYIFIVSSTILLLVGYYIDIATAIHGTMGISYAMLPGIFMIVHLKEIYNYTHKKIWFFLSVIPFAAIFIQFLILSVRGSMAALVLYMIFRTYKRIKHYYFRFAFVVAATLLSALAYLNVVWILEKLQSVLLNMGIKMVFIERMLWLISQEDILSGREILYEMLLFRFNPFIGQGIGDFYSTVGFRYMHNLFLQATDELGLLYLLPFIFFIGFAIKELVSIKMSATNYYNILGLFFFLAVPRLMVSDFYWRTVSFWLLIVFIISRLSRDNELEKAGE